MAATKKALSWDDLEPADAPALSWDDLEPAEQEFAPVEPAGFVRGTADIGLSLGQGAAGAFKALTDLAGPNAASRGLGRVGDFLGEQKSEQSKSIQKSSAERIRVAEESGSTWEEAKAYMSMIYDQPGEMIAQGVGSFATLGLGKAAQALKFAQSAKAAGVSKEAFLASASGKKAAQDAAEFGFKFNIGVGTGMGVGAVKGSQYEQTFNNAKAQGMGDVEATTLATEAQAYGGAGTGQQILGGGLGLLASATGPIERVLMGKGTREAGQGVAMGVGKGTIVEATTEGLQGAQERYAGNVAAIDAGVLAPEKSMRGVVGQGLMEGAIGGLLGGTAGAFDTRAPSDPVDLLNPKGGLTREQQFQDASRQAQRAFADAREKEEKAAAEAATTITDSPLTPAAPGGLTIQPPPEVTVSPLTQDGVTLPSEAETQKLMAATAQKEQDEADHKQIQAETLRLYGTVPIILDGVEIGVTYGGKPFYSGGDGSPSPDLEKAVNNTIKAELEARQVNPESKAHTLREAVIEAAKETGMVPAGKVTPAAVDAIIKKVNLNPSNAVAVIKNELKMLAEKKGKADIVKAGFYENLLGRLGGSVVTSQGDQNAIPVRSPAQEVSSPVERREDIQQDSGRMGREVQGAEVASQSQAEGEAPVTPRESVSQKREELVASRSLVVPDVSPPLTIKQQLEAPGPVINAAGEVISVKQRKKADRTRKGDPGAALHATATLPVPVKPVNMADVPAYELAAEAFLISGVDPIAQLAVLRVRETQSEGASTPSESFEAAGASMGMSKQAAHKRYREGISALKANALAADIEWSEAETLLGIAPPVQDIASIGDVAFEGGQRTQQTSDDFDHMLGSERDETVGVDTDEIVEGDSTVSDIEGAIEDLDVAAGLLDSQVDDAAERAMGMYSDESVQMAEMAWGEDFKNLPGYAQVRFVRDIDALVHRSRGDIATFEAGVKQLIGGENGRKYAREDSKTFPVADEKTEVESETVGRSERGGGEDGVATGKKSAPTVETKKRRVVAKPTETSAPEKTSERRANLAERKHVDEMGPDEMRAEIGRLREENAKSKLDEVTGIKNLKAYNEAVKLPVQIWIDVDSLGWVNDNLGEASGDDVLRAVAKELDAATEEAYRRGGDELVAQANSEEEAIAIVKAVQKELAKKTISATKGEETITVKGLGVSYGIADTYDKASIKGHEQKQHREDTGLRGAKGTEPPGTTRSRRSDGERLDAESDSALEEDFGIVLVSELAAIDDVGESYLKVMVGTKNTAAFEAMTDYNKAIDAMRKLKTCLSKNG